jgi:hypothetical protein
MTREEALDELAGTASDTFMRFLDSYFGHPMIVMRMEEDTAVWQELEGRERAVAIEMILDQLDSKFPAFVRAALIIRDERALPRLKRIAEQAVDPYHRLYAAKALFDWTGYEHYPELLWTLLPRLGMFGKMDAGLWVRGLPKSDAVKVLFCLLRDEEATVRSIAYRTLKMYFRKYNRLRKTEDEVTENRYFTSKEVYSNQPVFEARINELQSIVSEWLGELSSLD